ncbi:hypothetical protein HanRHA438_Chr06g0263741 [Helianthus annuus]|nr:hypothetical protein HanHA89_Chr06g0224281 [Helianthus annuus]KAJ0737629.1 hypothetical protein HanLR1_Chr06g0209131 [Helianthus annuus]KAJ0911489.1 hypothetical protein HanRHA438_Chr06g0263741 [Helianthus annuus]
MLRLFQNAFKEGCVYRIRKFVVHKYSTMYRPLRCDIFIQFLYSTSITTCPTHPSVFRRYVFDFLPFNLLADRVNDDKYLTDVIGVLREWGSVQYQLESVSSCNPGVNVSLWGHLVNQFSDGYIRRIAKNTVIIILSSCKVRSYKGMVLLSLLKLLPLKTMQPPFKLRVLQTYTAFLQQEMWLRRHWLTVTICVGTVKKMFSIHIMSAVSLLKISADELVNKSLSEPRSISTTADTANPPSAGVLQIDEETEMCAKIKDVEWEMADELFSSLVDNVVTPSKQSSVIVGNGRDASLSQSVVQPRSISTSVDAATPPSAGVLQIDEETEMCAKIKDVEWEMADEVFSSVVDNSLTPSTQSSIIGDNKTAGNHLQSEVEVKCYY